MTATTGGVAQSRSAAWRIVRVLALVRYRFFLYAGLLPYLLGATWAYAIDHAFDVPLFWSGLAGVVLAVVGVEAFNEYFDAQMGTDRIFNPADLPPITAATFWLGVVAFAVLGGMAAIFYEAPPIRWSYRGLGETVIGLAYGPWMVEGSLYLHTGTLSLAALWASLVPGLLIMALAVVNAIPDFHQDRLVGKRNLVVRLGRRRGVALYLALAAASLVVVAAGVAARLFPLGCIAALAALPFLIASARHAASTYEQPRRFVAAIRSIVVCYVVAVLLFTAGILAHAL